MIAPVMVAIFSEGLRAVPRGWIEGSLGLGVNRWRTFWKIARPHGAAGAGRRDRAGHGPGPRARR